MLIRLVLENIAIIESLTLEFKAGFNVITGETGSGKSLILDAIQRVFQKRANLKELLRHGASRGRIELTLDVSRIRNRTAVDALLKQAEVEFDGFDSELTLGREMSATGSRCHINGVPVSTGVMESLGSLLLEIFGQHDLHTLFSSVRQRDLLDNMGGEPLLNVKREVRRAYHQLHSLHSELQAVKAQKQYTERQIDFLTYQIQEIAQAELQDPQEDEQLQLERQRLSHAESLCHTVNKVLQILTAEDSYESPSMMKLLSQIQKLLQSGSTVDPQMGQWQLKFGGMQEELREVISDMGRYETSLETNPQRMQTILDRLDQLEKLKRKYGPTLDGVLKKAAELEAELDGLQQNESYLANLEVECQKAETQFQGLSQTLSDLRHRLAERLESSIAQELVSLLLPAAQFKIQLSGTSPHENGMDEVVFQFSANPGEPLRPLAQVASGGELARLMLALKVITAHSDELSTLILDEIDAGMSGITLRAVGEKLQALQSSCQIIVVTHHPIVAAKGLWHLHLQKQLSSDGVKVTALPLVDRALRKAVLSQIASGFQQEDTVTQQFIEQLFV